MRAAEIVGGVAVVGVAVLLGLSLMDDDEPAAFRTTDSLGLAAPSGTDAASTSTSTAPPASGTQASASPPDSESSAAPTTAEPTSAPTNPPTTTAGPSTTGARATTTTVPAAVTVPEEERDTIAVRVLNAGVEGGAARFVSGVLRQSGFVPLEPRDAPETVDATTILYAAGREAEGATVNAVIEADQDNVIEASDDDPGWEEFGADVDVLVLLGPG